MDALVELVSNCKHFHVFFIHPRPSHKYVDQLAVKNVFHIFPGLTLPIRGLVHEVTLVRPDGVIQLECQVANIEVVIEMIATNLNSDAKHIYAGDSYSSELTH
jgi:hypothetical protein